MVANELIRPAAHGELTRRAFAWWTRRMLSRDFHAVLGTPGSRDLVASLDTHDTPAIVCLSHAGWWDPLIGLHLSWTLNPTRRVYGPMQMDQLEKFGFFRKLGVFGIDPDAPASLRAMVDYLAGQSRAHPRFSLWITPQGQFTDVREPVRLRPGAAAVAAGMDNVRVLCVNIEYAFWNERRPCVFLHASSVPGGTSTMTGWNRAITQTLEQGRAELARRVIARDAAGFQTLLGGASVTSPLYDLWLRLRGRSGRLDAVARTPAGKVPA